MNKLVNKKVIVIGGTGETGKRIVKYLNHLYPDLAITTASRSKPPHSADNLNINNIKLDVNLSESAIDILKGFQLAIIAIGPMDKYAAQVHKLCLQANIDVIDINDSLEAADAIFSLHDQVKQQERRIFTGMGFSPGISTLLLMELAENQQLSDNYHCRLYMGAAYGGGESSPYAMLASFKNNMAQFINKQRLNKKTPWDDTHSQFKFPSQEKSVDLIPFSTPEIAGLSLNRGVSVNPIASLDSRYHIQFLSKGMAKFLAKFNLSEKVRDYFAKKFYAGGQSMKNKKNADPDTTLWVYPENNPEQGLLMHGVISSYDHTALMACAVAQTWLEGKLSDYQGVYAAEHLTQSTRQQLLESLSNWGIQYRQATSENLNSADIYFGWTDTPCTEVHQLRNYGENWYSISITHPKMKQLQKRFLVESDIWSSLKQQSTLAFGRFVVKTLLRWKKHNKQLTVFCNRQHGEDIKKWQTITKDISMFTSGYSCARELLGQEVAYTQYRRMFLDTGKMEMRWLWPKPETFFSFTNPEKAIIEYWLAFMKGYEKLGLFRLEIEQNDIEINCKITDCTYANMFIQLDCPELSNLVREMEQEALEFMCSSSNIEVIMIIGNSGSAEITLRNHLVTKAKAN